MGFLFYITDFWYWRWRSLLSLLPIHISHSSFLQTYYVNFYFVIADFPILRRLSHFIEHFA
ncbi:MAG: hypothetical protein RMI34_01345 [Chloroherpetonaceae bacterium]|nr:hypothetical protein [Chloroherpetonaceae bacterium]MCS7212556.1 hypothetical protein [Chloroherpetonaceae bacterium]MDW8018703.1 hypothetical protein [Chloroherpetonaceae bacterium]MDW8466313.1 hypothetical protein [Chloroherpetonaceae bacterium]